MKQQLFSKRAAPGDMQSFSDMPVPSTEGRYDIDAGFKKLEELTKQLELLENPPSKQKGRSKGRRHQRARPKREPRVRVPEPVGRTYWDDAKDNYFAANDHLANAMTPLPSEKDFLKTRIQDTSGTIRKMILEQQRLDREDIAARTEATVNAAIKPMSNPWLEDTIRNTAVNDVLAPGAFALGVGSRALNSSEDTINQVRSDKIMDQLVLPQGLADRASNTLDATQSTLDFIQEAKAKDNLTRNNNFLNQYLPGSVPAGPIPFGDQPTVNPFEGAMQDVANADFSKEELAKHRWDRNIQALGFGTVGAGLGGLTASMLSGSADADATDEERDRIASSRRRNALIGALLGGGLGYGASKLYREHA